MPGQMSSTLMNTSPPKEPGARRRKTIDVAVEALSSIAPVITFAEMFNATDHESSMSFPGYQVIITVGVMGVQLARDTLRITLTAEDALVYLRRAGNGAIFKGFASLSIISVLSMAFPIGYAVSYGAVINALQENAEAKNDTKLIVLFDILQNPLLQTSLLGIPALAIYGITKKFLYHLNHIKKNYTPARGHQLSMVNRFGSAVVFDVLESVFWGQMLRTVFLTFGPAYVVHSPFFTLAPVALNRCLLKPVRDYCYPEEAPPVVSCFTPKSAALYMAQSATMLAATLGLTWLLLGLIDEDRDPESMNQAENIVYEVGLMTLALFVGQAVALIPPFREHKGAWYHKIGLFKEKDPVLRPLIEEAYRESALEASF